MNKKQRIVLASRLRQFSELGRAGVSTETALGAAAVDNPAAGGKIADPAVPATFDEFLPESMPHTRALMSATGNDDRAVVAGAAADLLEEPVGGSSGMSMVSLSVASSGLVVITLSIFVLPVFKDMYESFGADLPAPTVLTLFLAQWFFAPLGALLLLGVVTKAIWKWRPALLGKLTPGIDSLLMKLPLISQVSRVYHTKQLAFWLAASGAGGDLKARLDCLIELAGHSHFSRQVARLSREIQGGQSLIEAAASPGWMPGLVMVLRDAAIASNDDNAATSKKLFAYASGLDARADALIRILSLAAHLFMGVVVGFFVVAMYLPIFKMGSSI